MRKTQTEIDVEVLKHIFTTKELEDEITLKEKVSCGNESNRKAFEITFNSLCNIGILENGKLHQDYSYILNLSINDVDDIINKTLESFQKFYTQNRKAFKLVNPNNYDNYKETINIERIREINKVKSSLNAFEDKEENKSKKEIHKIKYDIHGKHLHSLARHTRELLFGFIHNKKPKRMKRIYKHAALNPLDANQKHSRLAFKNVINIILKNDLKKISSSEIRDIVKNYYKEDKIKDIIKPPVGIASYTSRIIKVLELLELIEGYDKNNDEYNLKVPKIDKYRLGADTKAESIDTLVGEISKFKYKDSKDIERIKKIVEAIFDFGDE